MESLYTDDCVDCVVNGVTTRPIFLKRGLRQGCSLSPMLFALYIADIGNDINSSGLGVQLGSICVSGLLFADDILLISRSANGLLHLLLLVKSNCDRLRLTISVKKSEIISPNDINWSPSDGDVEVLSLKQVSQYKYLGTWTFGSMWRTRLRKQEVSISTAKKYKASCIYVSREGQDTVDVVLCTMKNVAIPAILYGCEMMPFSESTILMIERIQSSLAKFALGVSSNAPNLCAQSELGLKPFRQALYERQLGFYRRILFLEDKRWYLVESLSCSYK